MNTVCRRATLAGLLVTFAASFSAAASPPPEASAGHDGKKGQVGAQPAHERDGRRG